VAEHVSVVSARWIGPRYSRWILRASKDSLETLKSPIYMTAACGLSVAISAAVAPGIIVEIVVGMAAPLVVAVATIVAIERVYRRDPRQLTPLMIKAFGAKMVLFGGYVASVITLTSLSPTPFILSFCVSFIGLHMTEAFLLRSLFADAIS
jgi:predicted neutral ceramidase superfamily lipid hydrolase